MNFVREQSPTIYATADLHGCLPDVPDCDIFIIAGDITPLAVNPNHLEWFSTVFFDYLCRIKDRGTDIVAIAGNHDFVLERQFGAIRRDMPWIYLKDSEVTLRGLRIYGTPWVPRLPSWAFHASEAQLEENAAKIPSELDILISHGPPFGFGDYVAGLGCIGDLALRDALREKRPKVLINGHIHEGFGLRHYISSDTEIYNVAHVDEFYDIAHPPVRIDV